MSERDVQKSLARKHLWIILPIVVQSLILTVLIAVPFGFDRASDWGLDYTHFLLGILLYCVAVASGAVAAFVRKQWWLLALQAGIALIAAIAFLWPFFVPDLLHFFGRSQ